MIDESEKEMIGQLGEVLGLDKGFIVEAQTTGQEAVIDRLGITDEIGAMTRLMMLIQYLGIYMEERIVAGDPADKMEVLEALGEFSEDVDMDPGMAVALVGPVLEVFEQATGLLMRGETNADARGRAAGTRLGRDEQGA